MQKSPPVGPRVVALSRLSWQCKPVYGPPLTLASRARTDPTAKAIAKPLGLRSREKRFLVNVQRRRQTTQGAARTRLMTELQLVRFAWTNSNLTIHSRGTAIVPMTVPLTQALYPSGKGAAS